MKLDPLFSRGRQVLSFEVFPPKRTLPKDTVYTALEGLRTLEPDFISVTYGAGGSDNSAATLEIASAIQDNYDTVGVAHLPGIHLSKEDAAALLDALSAAGIHNVLALRGDVTEGLPLPGDFPHASDLAAFIREAGDFHILGACYPEGHTQAGSLEEDMEHLKIKVDAGVGHLISQLFFDNRYFFEFRERAAAAGIDVPVEAGIMPVVNTRQIERMVSLCGASLPPKFVKMMARYEGSPEALRDAGIAYAVDQIVDLLANDVDGIHLYTMNSPAIAHKVCEAVAPLFGA